MAGVAELPNVVPTWEAFSADYITPALPVYCVVRERPLVRLFVSANANRIGCVLAVAKAEMVPLSNLKEVSICNVTIEGGPAVEISTATVALFRHFYALLECVCESVVRRDCVPQDAIFNSLRDWQTLLRSALLLTEERQTGLYGELWMVNRLIDSVGPETSVKAWVGPRGQAHDFRLADLEFEVKTTASEVRRHYINGLTQLRPSPDRKLYLISLHLTQAGAIGGETLPEAAVRVRERLSAHTSARAEYDELLDTKLGLRLADYPHYPRRWQMRSAPRFIPVLDGCPRLVPEALAILPPGYEVGRITEATYQINVDGLGADDNSDAFLAVLPHATGGDGR
jgi:hypothetical protein